MINNAIFITGTDTEVGKTATTVGLLKSIARLNRTAIGMKPVASGAQATRDGLRNDDALQLLKFSNPQLDYSIINPYVFKDPTSPHIAASAANEEITLDNIVRAFEICQRSADIVIVEGIGGWRVPLSNSLQTVDLVRALKLPTILVCGLRLGCINHTLLTVAAIQSDAIPLLGWIGNVIDRDYAYRQETISTLKQRIDAPLLGIIEWREPIDTNRIGEDLDPLVRKFWG
ncbi:MAG: dethiobiotin synthase [Proteobacteria bacterium]|nr:dethiobiotin synthase [Pseudomonadota bacterium]